MTRPTIKLTVNGAASQVDTINEAVHILREAGMSREPAKMLVRAACMPSTKRIVTRREDMTIELIAGFSA